MPYDESSPLGVSAASEIPGQAAPDMKTQGNCGHTHPSVKTIVHDGCTLAIIVSSEFQEPGIHFFTPSNLSQQLAYMQHPTGKIIEPHVHNRVTREVHYTQEVLIIRKGKLRVDFYDRKQTYLESRMLIAGDIIMLIDGGHGFEVIEDVTMIEVKQGPFAGPGDKTRFPCADRQALKLISS